MAATVGEMTVAQLQQMMEAMIEEKLIQLLGDPDEGLTLKKSVRDRLRKQQQAVAGGERGEPLAEVVRRLELA